MSGTVLSADLLSEIGQFSFPTTIFRPGSATYDAGTGALQVNASATRTLMSNTDVRNHAASPASTVAINLRVLDAAGTAVEGIGSNALEVIGAFDVDGNGTIEASESGVMLTGQALEIQQMNLAPAAGGSDRVAMRFRATGGFLAPYYAGRNIGVDLALNNDGSWPAPATPGADFGSSFVASVVTSQIKPIPCGVQIGEFVWHDVDADGIQDPGEPGINGVRMLLRNSSGAVIATALTGRGPLNQGGYYLFERIAGLCAGNYTVEVDSSTIPPGFFPTVSGAGSDAAIDSQDSPASVTVARDITKVHTLDFGFATVYNGRIAGRVWHDANGDGIQDDGEPGIDRVVVNAYNATTGALVGTSTSIDGNIGFTGLEPGDYRLEPDATSVPRGFAPTLSDVGSDDTDSDLPAAIISLTALKTMDRSAGFGYVSVCTSTIGDYVWYDKNQNGIQDEGESGLAGVDVSLLAEDGSVVATMSTGANGAYQFVGLCGGNYRVVIDQADLPTGFSPTVAGAGNDESEDSNAIPALVVMSDDNTTNDNTDFGFVAPCSGSIGNRVWLDSNLNGIQDSGEPGFGGVTVNLRRRADYAIIQTDISDADGSYEFSGLCPGEYVVELALSDDLSLSPANRGADAVDSNVNPSVVILAQDDSSNANIDFGVYVTGQIGDFVWHDVNADGIQGDGEPGLAGVTVRLTYPSGVTVSTVTNAAGAYHFTSLARGTYIVDVVTPAGYVGPTQPSAQRPDFDSNPSPSTVTLAHHDTKQIGIDFGFTKSTPPPPPPAPGIKIVKTANKHRLVYGESVTFTYTVTNTGTTILRDIVVRDDNATPTYSKDDFTVGTLTSLAPGASHTFTNTLVPPAKMCNEDRYGKLRKCGMMIFKLLSAHVEFTYLQSRDHREDYWDWNGWDGKRSYTKKGKFRVADIFDVDSQDVNSESVELDGDDGDEYISAYKVSASKQYVSHSNYVKAPKIYHKKGWDGDWKDDWDYRWGNYTRGGRWDDDRRDRDNDHDYDYDKHPKLCPTTSTNIGTVTAKSDGVVLKATDKETVEIVGPAVVEKFKTFTQGGWGSKPSGNNPGKFLVDNFKTVFPLGYVVVGGNKTIKLTSASAIEKFLPQGGTPARLTQNYVNPTAQINVLAGQVLTLKLNVEFSAKGLTRAGLGNLTVVSGKLEGRTVSQVLAIANTALGGGSLPNNVTLSDLNAIVSKINENFDGGQNNGYLED